MQKIVVPLIIALLTTQHVLGVTLINHTDGGIQVDGFREAAWDNATQLDISRLVYGSIQDDNDFSGTGWMIWNEVGLYLFVEIHDDVFNDSESVFSTPWEDDTVEVYLDLNNSKNQGYYDDDDVQFFINFDNDYVQRNNHVLNIGNGIKQIVRRRDWIAGVKTIEVMLPWQILKFETIQGGMQFGFDILLNDDDDGGPCDAKLSWNMTANEAFFDPSKMGTIELGGSEYYPLTSPAHQRTDHFLYTVFSYRDAPASTTLSEAASWIQKLEKFYRDSSENRYVVKIHLVPSVIQLPGTQQEYQESVRDLSYDIHNHMVANNEYTYLSGTSYDYYICHFPRTWTTFSGRYNDGVVWVNDIRGYASGWMVLAHEMGHAIGLMHCSMTDGQRVSPLADGEWLEYGSPDDTMGNPQVLGEFNLSAKAHLRWVLPSQIHLDPDPGTYRIYAHDQNNLNDINGIHLTNPRYSQDPPIDYWISLRANPASQQQSAVQVHLNPPQFSYSHGFYSAELLDMTPEDGVDNGYEMPLNEWYWDSWNNHAFRVISKGETAGKAWADIEVENYFDGADAEVLHPHLGRTHSYQQGWTYTEGFGFLQLVRDGYAYHPQKGWLFIAGGDFQNGLILYHPAEQKWYFCSQQTPITPLG